MTKILTINWNNYPSSILQLIQSGMLLFSLFVLMACKIEKKEHKLKSNPIDTKLDKSKQDKDSVFQEYLSKKLLPIRTYIKKINSLQNWTKIDTTILNQSSESGIARFYFQKEKLLKITVSNFAETGKNIQKFYLQNGQLLFVLEQNFQYNRPIYWDLTKMKENNDTEVFDVEKSEMMEDKSYFENDVLIRQINNQDCGSPYTKGYLNQEQIRLMTQFEKLKKSQHSKK